jgi:hypothetical protein
MRLRGAVAKLGCSVAHQESRLEVKGICHDRSFLEAASARNLGHQG